MADIDKIRPDAVVALQEAAEAYLVRQTCSALIESRMHSCLHLRKPLPLSSPSLYQASCLPSFFSSACVHRTVNLPNTRAIEIYAIAS